MKKQTNKKNKKKNGDTTWGEDHYDNQAAPISVLTQKTEKKYG